MHLNALRFVNNFVLQERGENNLEEKKNVEELIMQTERRNVQLLQGILLRGLKSCSSNYEALSCSLMALRKLLELEIDEIPYS